MLLRVTHPNLLPPAYREQCRRCLRAASVCNCAKLEPFTPRFKPVLLQHPKERKNNIGTARITHLCLANSRLIAGTEFDGHPDVEAILNEPANRCVVLFPGEAAIDLDALGPEPLPALLNFLETSSPSPSSFPQLVVFVIDGTWAQAKGMLRKSTRLGTLPRVSFRPAEPSNYRVRKQPNPLCLSTIEASHRLVRILDPESDPSILLKLFDDMVERQIAFASRGRLREMSVEALG